MDLNPYGHVPPARKVGPIYTYDDPALAASRAGYKLARWRQGLNIDTPAGAALWWPGLVGVVGMAEIAFGFAMWRHTGYAGTMLLGGPLGLYLLLVAWRTYVRSLCRNPADCMREFVHCIQRGDMSRAWLLVAPVDRDNYTRAAPSVTEHDPVSVKRFAFDSRTSFAAYWRAARSLGPASRLRLRVVGRANELAPGLAQVTIEAEVQRTLMLQSGKRTVVVNKLLLQHGNEWRVFDGEVIPAPELDPGWLKATQ